MNLMFVYNTTKSRYLNKIQAYHSFKGDYLFEAEQFEKK